MLSMLDIIPAKQRGPVARQWRRLFPPPVSACLNTAGNTPYIKITCEEHKKGIDWRMAAAHSLDGSGRLLLPRDIACPVESGLRRFVPTRFVRRMLENLALEVMLCSDIPPAQRSMALYGSEAEIIQLLPRLIPLVGEVRIITRRGYAVADIVEQTRRETGMSITVTDEPDCGGCSVLLAPFGGAGFVKTRPDTVVFSPDRPSGETAAWVSSVQLSVPAVLEEAYGEQYDLLEFVGAFYELSGMRELARLSPDFGCCGQSRITARQLAELLRHSTD